MQTENQQESISLKQYILLNELNGDIQNNMFKNSRMVFFFFWNGHGTFSKKDHMLVYKTILNKFKKVKIKSRIFIDHSVMKLEVNYKKKIGNK